MRGVRAALTTAGCAAETGLSIGLPASAKASDAAAMPFANLLRAFICSFGRWAGWARMPASVRARGTSAQSGGARKRTLPT